MSLLLILVITPLLGSFIALAIFLALQKLAERTQRYSFVKRRWRRC